MDLQVISPLLYHFLYFLSFLQLPEVCIVFINQKKAKVFFLLRRRIKIEHVWTFLFVCKSANVGTRHYARHLILIGFNCHGHHR